MNKTKTSKQNIKQKYSKMINKLQKSTKTQHSAKNKLFLNLQFTINLA